MSNLVKNLIFALILALLLWAGYVFFIKESDEALVSQSRGANTEQAELETQQLLARLQELKSYDVSGALFADQRFVNLMDYRTYLGEEPAGRTNPFAPLR